MRRLPLIIAFGAVIAACALVLPFGAGAAATNTVTSIASVSSLNPVAGADVTFTVDVATTGGAAVSGGTVSIVDANNQTWATSATISNGAATVTVSGLPEGTIIVHAHYSGYRTIYGVSDSDNVTLNVGGNALPRTKTVVTADKTNITAGDTINFSIQVTNLDGSTVPTGTVTLTASAGGTQVNLFPNSQLAVNPANGGMGVVSDEIDTPGTYAVIPQFQGDQYQPSTAQTIIITVNAAASSVTETTTTVIANGGAITVSPNDDVVLTATVTQTQAISPPAGDVVTFYRQSATGYIETLAPQGNIVWDVTDGSKPATGTATVDFGQWPRGDYTVTAQFIGDQFDKASSGKTVVGIHGPEPTTTTYKGDLTGVTGTPITLTGKLVDPSGNAIGGEPLTLALNGNPAETCTTDPTTNAGMASCQVTVVDLPGSYPVTATFAGDGDLQPSSGSDTVVIKAPTIIPTTVTYTGDTTGVAGTQETISFVLSSPLGLLPNELVAVSVDGGTPVLYTTNASGVVSFQAIEPAGSHSITASFAGDGAYQPSSGPGSLTVSRLPTQLTYDGATTGLPTSPSTISFKLTDPTNGNAALAGKTVAITINGQTHTATSAANGDASFQITLPGGTFPISASFDGSTDPVYDSSQATGQIVVKLPTSLTYDGDTLITGGGAANVSFKLTDPTNNNSPLGTKTVSITVNGHTYPGLVTNASGDASISLTLPAGTYPASASFDGTNDPLYLSTTGAGQLVVKSTPTTTTVLNNPSVAYGSPIVLNAKLVDVNGNPLGGELVTLTIGSGPDTCTGTTHADGTVTCTVTNPTSGAGTYVVNAKFTGDGALLPSSGTGSVTVTQATTTIVDNVTGNFLLGSPLTLSGTLTSGGKPVANEPLTLKFGTATCTTGPTNASGTATCVVSGGVPGPTGPTTTYAIFNGDANYKAATDNKPALVYAFAPGGGSFVVGDKTATGSVYFWGSQWWKKNVLSAGDRQAVDPGAFKGFALNPSTPQCGKNWTTFPGNSPPPPNGPLPAYMAVIVTDKNHKAPGRIASGDTVSIVIVKTDAGYSSDPGHDGTGTVVATVCTGGTDDGSSGAAPIVPAAAALNCATGKCESQIANPTVLSSAVVEQQTLGVLYANDTPLASATVAILGDETITPMIVSVSGYKPTYATSYGGSKNPKYESGIIWQMPIGYPAGTYVIQITTVDTLGYTDQYNWSITVA